MGRYELPNGVRQVEVSMADGSRATFEGAATVEVFFGPHHLLRVGVLDGRTFLDLVTTHHGVHLDAHDVGGQVEEIIEHLRQHHPDAAFD